MVGPNKLWLSIKSCLHILAAKKAYFYNSLDLKYDYEFLNCILRKMKLGGGENLSLIRGSQVGLENLSNFRTPLVLKVKFSAVLATSSTFCFSEQCLSKI